jgi:hypothetical protein
MGLYKRDKKLGKAVRHDIRILEKKLRIQAKRIVENREVRFYQPAGPFGRMTPLEYLGHLRTEAASRRLQ